VTTPVTAPGDQADAAVNPGPSAGTNASARPAAARKKKGDPSPPVTGAAFSVGIDENGLGPRLGPLVVTAILCRTTPEGARVANARPRGAIRARLDDSKKLVSYADSGLGEAWARAIAARTGKGASAADPDALVHAIALDARDAMRAPCPTHHVGQCWDTHEERFGAEGALVAKVGKDLDKLASQGVEIVGVRVAVVCTKRLNEAVARGLSRFDVDLHTMERLVLAARADAGVDLFAACGKVGGFDRYAPSFGPLSGHLHTALVEGRARSEYRVLGVGNVAFVRDADQSHLLVCMASLVGKWVRDLLMRRIVRFHREAVPELPDASGYHDPVTTRFIDASALSRKARRLDDACFVRARLGPAS
jgi:ribonuclease HII